MAVDRLQHALLFACCLLAWSGVTRAGQPITVGADGAMGSCDFTTVQAALDAADVRGGAQIVRVSRNVDVGVYDGAWADQNLAVDLVAGQSIALTGGYDTCADSTSDGRGILSGEGGASAPVLRIRGAGAIAVTHLEIVKGDADAATTGGGIDFLGSGFLSLQDVALNDNDGTEGGAIRFESSGGAAQLELLGLVSVARNFAGHGGGLFLSAPANDAPALVTMGDDVALTHNEVSLPAGMGGAVRAVGYVDLSLVGERFEVGENRAGLGGGFSFGDAVVAMIGATPAPAAPATFHHNRAQFGGAISLDAGASKREASLTMFSLDPARPLSFTDNEASTTGAAFRMASFGGAPLRACLQNVHVANNRSPSGVIEATGTGAQLRFNACGLPPGIEIACAVGQACNRIEQNSTMLPGTPAPTGTIFQIGSGASVAARHLRLHGNVGTALFTTLGGGGAQSRIEIDDSLITSNQADNALFVLQAPTDASAPNRVRATTIAGSVLQPGYGHFSIQSSTDLVIEDTLFASPAYIVNYPFNTTRPPQLRRIVAGSLIELPPGADVVQGTPVFEADFTYTLADGSIGLDMLPGRGGVDLYGNPRDIDRSDVPGPGVRDVGAIESPTSLFRDGFEGPP